MDFADGFLEDDPIDMQSGPSPSSRMTKVENARAEPFRYVCSIEATFDQEVYDFAFNKYARQGGALSRSVKMTGSGFVISPHHVLTAAHVVNGWKTKTPRGRQDSIQAAQVRVTPARRPSANPGHKRGPFGVWKVKRIMTPNQAFSLLKIPTGQTMSQLLLKSRAFDFALLEIKPKRSAGGGVRQLGYAKARGSKVPLGWWCRSGENAIKRTYSGNARNDLRKRRINVAGYPYAETRWDQMYKGFDDVQNVRKNIIEHEIKTRHGISGGPIWTFDGRRPKPRQLVAISVGKWGRTPKYALSVQGLSQGSIFHIDFVKFLKDRIDPQYLCFV